MTKTPGGRRFMNLSVKRGMLLITYAVVLYLVLSHIGTVTGAISTLLTVLKPVLLGILMAYILNLLLRPMETCWLRKVWERFPKAGKHRRGICIVFSILIVLAILTTLSTFILPQVGESIANLANAVPGYINNAAKELSGLEERLDMDNIAIRYLWEAGEKLLAESADIITKIASNMVPWALGVLATLTSGLLNAAVGLVFAIYILADKEHLASIFDRLLHALFRDSVRERIVYITNKADRAFGGFITGQLTEAVILGALCFTGLTIIGFFVDGMPYAFLISVLVGFCNIIPILGAYLSAIPSTLLILLISPVKALIFVIFLVVVQQFEGNVIYPKVVGSSIGIGGLWVLLALTVGGKLFGLPGMVLGIPAFAVIYSLVREFTENRIQMIRASKDAAAKEAGSQSAEPSAAQAPKK